MKRFLNSLFLLLTAATAFAQIPNIRIHTSIYEKDGPTNAFTLVLGAADGHNGFADVVCSGGNQSEVEIQSSYFDSAEGALIGTYVSCQVDEKGLVEVYCDEGVIIDYLSCAGAEITRVEFLHPEEIKVLALEHNQLEELDLTPFENLNAVYLQDNPMSKSPLIDFGTKDNLQIMEIQQIENIYPGFDIFRYPNLIVFDAMSTHGLQRVTPEACPLLMKLSIDNTSVSYLDVTKNPDLLILNISETRIPSVDLTRNTRLQQFYCTHSSAFNTDIKLSEIDLTHCPDLYYLFLSDNKLTSLDLSHNPLLHDLYVRNNHLTSLDLSANTDLVNVFITGNDMDFTTLPLPQDTWGDYELHQRPLDVPSSCLVGSAIDLSARVLHPGADTYANLYRFDETNPDLEIEVDPSLYTFENGVLTINEAISDSVYAVFFSTAYPNTLLSTRRFMVKSFDQFGKPNLMASFDHQLPEGTTLSLHVGLANAKLGNQRSFFVDMGDGTMREFKATTTTTPAEPNVVAQACANRTVRIFMPEGETLTALKIEGIALDNLDLSNAAQIAELTLTDTQLRDLDLQWNRLLQAVDIMGNDFGDRLSLAGANGGYNKNLLTHINLSRNNMSRVVLNQPGSWQYIDLSHNHLSDLNFTDADYVRYLDLSHNDFAYLKINYLGELKTFYCNDNQLTELVLPETNVIETFNCAHNAFTLNNMPDRNGLDEEHFIYAPQREITIPSKGPGYNLSDQDVKINGARTVFTWRNSEGRTLVAGTDFTISGGVTQFADVTIGQELHCEMSHPAYPALRGENVLRTTAMLSAGMPTHLMGEFTTTQEGQEASLTMTSLVDGDAVYIDWTGTNSLEQYPLTTTYRNFKAKTKAGAHVKVWSYGDDDNLTVFSLSGAKLSDVDLSPMKHLVHLTLAYSGISSLVWPQSPGIRELSFEGCAFDTFDFTRYPQLYSLNMDYNRFQRVDLSGLSNLGAVAFAYNNLKEIRLGDNNELWQLSLSNNQLTEIDLKGAPALQQLFLNNNRLSHIDLDNLAELRVVYLDANRFDFSTLPLPREQWVLYTYGSQPQLTINCLEGKVDLSSQAMRDTVATTYTWFYGLPSFDSSTGSIVGEALIEGEEYSIEGGVTTFYQDLDQVCCVLTNELFPNTYLQTNVTAVYGASGVASLRSDALAVTVERRDILVSGLEDGTLVSAYTVDGRRVARATSQDGQARLTVAAAGLYVVSVPQGSVKVAVE